MSKEFLEAAVAMAKRSRRTAVGVELVPGDSPDSEFFGRSDLWNRFVPRWLLIETCPGLMLEDVLFGNQSQFAGHGPVPASVYSIADAQQLFESPDSPAWDRFKFEDSMGMPIGAGRVIMMRASLEAGRPRPPSIHAVFIGDEPAFKNWEVETRGTLVGVALTGAGPVVEVVLGEVDYSMRQAGLLQAPVRIPIKPSDIPLLVAKIGKRVCFKLQTEE